MMESRKITSLQHPLVKHLVKLRLDGTYRDEHHSLIIEGLKPIQELSSYVINLFFTAEYSSYVDSIQAEKWLITDAVLKKISGMTSPEGIVAEIKMPTFVSLGKSKRVLALDGINDPGNLGTLLRTALALGWESIYFLPGTCDPFNEKSLRAARGAQFKLSLIQGSADELKQWVKMNRIPAYVADVMGTPPNLLEESSSCLLVLGNEAHGASEEVRNFCLPVTIPMPGEMESLNVAVAGGILLYLLSNQSTCRKFI